MSAPPPAPNRGIIVDDTSPQRRRKLIRTWAIALGLLACLYGVNAWVARLHRATPERLAGTWSFSEGGTVMLMTIEPNGNFHCSDPKHEYQLVDASGSAIPGTRIPHVGTWHLDPDGLLTFSDQFDNGSFFASVSSETLTLSQNHDAGPQFHFRRN